MTVAERFTENLLILRKRCGLSQEQLALIAALHRTEVGNLERGLRLPRIDTVIKLAGALEVAPGDLLRGMAWVSSDGAPGHFIVSPAERSDLGLS